MSISKVQRQNINYLDSLSKGLQSVEAAKKEYANLPEVEKLLAHYGGKVFYQNALGYINEEGLVYKGELKELLTFSVTDNKNGKYSLSVGYPTGKAIHWQFVNYGVKGIRSGNSIKGFSFKTPNPSRKMVDNMREYISVKGASIRTITPITSQETKAEDIANQQAYMLAKMIKMYGIKPREYMEKAAAKTFDKDFASKVAMAVGKDIKIFIRKWQ